MSQETRATVYGVAVLTRVEAAKLATALVEIEAHANGRVLIAEGAERGLLIPTFAVAAFMEAVELLAKRAIISETEREYALRVLARCNSNGAKHGQAAQVR